MPRLEQSWELKAEPIVNGGGPANVRLLSPDVSFAAASRLCSNSAVGRARQNAAGIGDAVHPSAEQPTAVVQVRRSIFPGDAIRRGGPPIAAAISRRLGDWHCLHSLLGLLQLRGRNLQQVILQRSRKQRPCRRLYPWPTRCADRHDWFGSRARIHVRPRANLLNDDVRHRASERSEGLG